MISPQINDASKKNDDEIKKYIDKRISHFEKKYHI